MRHNPAVHGIVQFHCAIPDGVFVTDGADLRFEARPAPTDAELDALLRNRPPAHPPADPPDDEPQPDALDFLESAQHAALAAWQPARNDAPPKRERQSAFLEGFSLHEEMSLLMIERDSFQGDWNYVIRPRRPR